jgi:hypothetical protein
MTIGSDVTNTTRPNRKGNQSELRGKRKLIAVTLKQLKKKQVGREDDKTKR